MSKDWKKVIDFWFNPDNTPFWFKKSEEFDEKIKNNFEDIWKEASEGLLFEWRQTIEGRLAEIIVLDQFSRNLCRNSPLAFAQDSMALVLAQEALSKPEFSELTTEKKKFMIMPFMHSESEGIHKEAVKHFEELGDDYTTKYEYLHKDIIDRFGRYPHRNEVLNRESTQEELEFLKQPGSSF